MTRGSPTALQRFVEVIAQTVRSDDEEDLELLAVAFVDAAIADFYAAGLEIGFYAFDVRDQDGRAVLGGIAAVDGEADAGAVALQDHGGARRVASFLFHHAEGLGIPLTGGVEIRHR